jgi:NADH-quinone oxidoreductase subunit E/NADP-reducing hydrogenase subunit HndA
MGTACFVRGAEKVLDEFKDQLDIDEGETTIDKMFTLKNVRCVGACGLAPVVMINEKVYGHIGPDDVAGIIEEYRKKEEE